MAIPLSDDADQQSVGASRQQPLGAGALGSVIKPFVSTGRYYTQSWRDYLGHERSELPIARPTIALATQAFRDEIALLGLQMHRPVSEPRAFERITREVVAALRFYGRRGWLDRPEGFFAKPPSLTDVTSNPASPARGPRFGNVAYRSVPDKRTFGRQGGLFKPVAEGSLCPVSSFRWTLRIGSWRADYG